MISRILVALDASVRAPAVMAAAAELARPFSAELRLLRVIFIPPEFPPAAHVVHADGLRAYMETEALQQLEALASGAGVSRSISSVRVGTPWSVILDEAEAVRADLIVIGSHGYRIADRVLGSTAVSVANRARCSVLVVHDPTR